MATSYVYSRRCHNCPSSWMPADDLAGHRYIVSNARSRLSRRASWLVEAVLWLRQIRSRVCQSAPAGQSRRLVCWPTSFTIHVSQYMTFSNTSLISGSSLDALQRDLLLSRLLSNWACTETERSSICRISGRSRYAEELGRCCTTSIGRFPSLLAGQLVFPMRIPIPARLRTWMMRS